MKRIAVIFESSPFDRKGLFNAVHNRTLGLVASGEFEVDAYCMHIRDSFISSRLRKTSKVPYQQSVKVDSVDYKILWRPFSYMDELRRRFGSLPSDLLTYASEQANNFKDYDVVVAHSYEAGLVALETNKKFQIPYAVTWHGSDVHTHPMSNPGRRSLTAKIMENAAANFFVSAALLEASSKITDNAQKAVLYNGVSESFTRFDDETRTSLREKYGLAPEDKVVAYVGNFYPVKNVTVLPELFSRIHDHFEILQREAQEIDMNLKFWVVGDGKLRNKVEPLVLMSAGTDVRFWGNVQVDLMPEIMNCVDILLLPSRNEGLPLVTLEALACGASVLGSEVGGIPEVIGKDFCVPFDVKEDGTLDYHSSRFADKLAQKTVQQLLYPKTQNYDARFSWNETSKKEIAFLKSFK